jgi:hypothetical protein
MPVPLRLLALTAALASPAVAAEPATVSQTFKPDPVAGYAVFQFRGGLSTDSPFTHPTLCAEITPLERFGVEMCGNGAGFLHQADVPDLAHFRARATVLTHEDGRWTAAAVVGAGLAELQTGTDRPGFQIADTGPGMVEAAGPELSVSASGRAWIGEKAFAVVDANVGAAYIPGAPSALGRGGPILPFALVTAGLGF